MRQVLLLSPSAFVFGLQRQRWSLRMRPPKRQSKCLRQNELKQRLPEAELPAGVCHLPNLASGGPKLRLKQP